jgi:DNA adenine methylase
VWAKTTGKGMGDMTFQPKMQSDVPPLTYQATLESFEFHDDNKVGPNTVSSRTCFNGLYRVNRNGLFNVPWGKYVNPSICDSNNLRNVSHVLRNCKVTIKAADYKEIILQNAKEDDFIYLDPPYSPVSSTAYFTNYTNNGFSNKDQEKLAEIYRQLVALTKGKL